MTAYAFKFTLIVFGMLLTPLALVAPFLTLNCVLIAGILLFAPTGLPAAEAVQYCGWNLAPLVLFGVILGAGILCARWVRGNPMRPASWLAVWVVYGTLFFSVVWFLISLLGALGASDYSTASYLRWTTQAACLVTVVGQPVIIVWLAVASRIVSGLHYV